MNPRNIGAWVARILLSAGIVIAVSLGTTGAAQASDASQASCSVAPADSGASTNADPTWE